MTFYDICIIDTNCDPGFGMVWRADKKVEGFDRDSNWFDYDLGSEQKGFDDFFLSLLMIMLLFVLLDIVNFLIAAQARFLIKYLYTNKYPYIFYNRKIGILWYKLSKTIEKIL